MFSLEPIDDGDFDFRHGVYEATIKPYIDERVEWDDAQHREAIRSNLAESGNHFAIVVGEARVGVAQIEETEDLISLHQIEMLPEHQGKGIGTAVVRSLVYRANAGSKDVHLSVFTANLGARRLYERLGFRVKSESEHDVQMRYTPPSGRVPLSGDEDDSWADHEKGSLA